MFRRSILSLFACAASLASGPALGAEPTPAAEQRETEARTRCLAGDVQGGVAILADLYVQSRDPIYIHNQARCFQQNGRARDAVLRFREYLRMAGDVTADERQRIEGYIRELELAPPPAASTPAPAPAPATEKNQPTATVATGAPPSSRARTLKIAALATGAGGVALVGMGVYFGVQVGAIEKRVEKRALEEGIVDRAEQQRGRSAARWQWIGYGTGVAALAAAAGLYVFSLRADRATEAATIVPVVTARQAGAAFMMSF